MHRITIIPEQCGGVPCISGIPVTDVLHYLASDMRDEQILETFPDLTGEDIKACIAFAAQRLAVKEPLKTVGVMGSGEESYPELATQVAATIASLGCNLLTGAGGGVMNAVAAAFLQSPNRVGRSIGIVRAERLPSLAQGSREWTARSQSENVEIIIKTHLPLSGMNGKDFLSRNHINVLSSDAVVVLPGGPGTMAELQLAIEYKKPTILFTGEEKINNRSAEDFQREFKDKLSVATQPDELYQKLRDSLGIH